MAFALHPQIVADTVPVKELELSSLRLMNVAALPWLVLIPRREALREIIDLGENDQATLWKEIAQVSRTLSAAVNPTKLNVAALGNVVPQLHVHIIARFEDDPAWPKPVWGNLPTVPYIDETREALLQNLLSRF